MAESGIWISILPKLELAALASVVGQLKSIMGKAGTDSAKAFEDPQMASVKRLEDAKVAAANRAAAAQIKADKLAADAAIAENQRVGDSYDVMTAAQLKKKESLDATAAVLGAKAGQASAEAEQAAGKASAATDEHAAALAGATTATTKYGGALNVAGVAATGLFAVLGGAGVEAASKYERGLAGLQAQTDQSATSMKTLHDGLLQLAPQLGRSLNELTDASTVVAKSGPAFQDAAYNLQLVAAASQLASIEGAPLENTIKALTNTMTDFAFPASKMVDVASMIKTAAGDAKVGINEFAGSLHNIEPAFTTLVNGDASKAAPLFAQMAALVAGQTQNGTGGDQASENVRNMLLQLVKGPKSSREAYGNLGGRSYEKEVSGALSDPNVGPVGVLEHLNDLVKSKLTPEGQVHISELYQSADAANALKSMYDQLTPAQKTLADEIQNGTAKYSDMKSSMKENVDGSDAMLKQWNTQRETLEGFNQKIKQYGGDMVTLQQEWKDLTGTDQGFLVAAQNFGNPAAIARTNAAVSGIQGSKAEMDNGKQAVQGWAEVQDTLSQKIKDTNSSFQAMATTMGESLLPEAKKFADVMKDIFDYLGDHKGLLDGIVKTLGVMALGWAAVRSAMAFKSVWSAMATGIDMVIGKFALMRTAANDTAATIETDAVAEEGSLAGVGKAASLSAGNVAMLAGTLDVIAHQFANGSPIRNIISSAMPEDPTLHDAGANAPWYDRSIIGDIWRGISGDKNGGPATSAPDITGTGGNGPHGGTMGTYRQRHAAAQATLAQATPDATDDSATGPTPDSYMGDENGGGPGNSKSDKTPAGSSDDPFYIIDPATQKAAETGGKTNPWDDYDPLSEAASGGFSLPNIAKMGTTFLAELALGNPLGKLQAQKLGSSPNNPMYTSDVNGDGQVVTSDQYKSIKAGERVDKAQDSLDKDTAKYGADSTQAQKAQLALTRAQESQQNLATQQTIKGGLNLSTIPVAAQKYANDCIDASAQLILSHSGINMTQDQLEGVITPGGSISSLAAGLNQLDPQGNFVAMQGSGGSQQAMSNAIKESIDKGVGSILNVAPGSSLGGHTFAPGHFIAATGYNPDGTINVSDTAGGRQYAVSPQDAFQATQGRGIVSGAGAGAVPIGSGANNVPGPGRGGPRGPSLGPMLNPPSPFGPQPSNGGTGQIGPFATPAGLGLPGGLGGGPGAQAARRGGATGAPADLGTAGTPHAGTGAPPGPGNSAAGQAQAVKGGSGPGAGVSGGVLGAAESAASTALNGLIPGAGAATQIATQEANRFAGYLGQLGGIAASGLLETFQIHGSDATSSGGIFGKIAGGLAGAHPVAPNTAANTQPAQKPDDKSNQKNNGDGKSNGPLVVNNGDNHYHNTDNGEVTRQQNLQLMQASAANPI